MWGTGGLGIEGRIKSAMTHSPHGPVRTLDDMSDAEISQLEIELGAPLPRRRTYVSVGFERRARPRR